MICWFIVWPGCAGDISQVADLRPEGQREEIPVESSPAASLAAPPASPEEPPDSSETKPPVQENSGSPQAGYSEASIRLVVSCDYGQETVFDSRVKALANSSVMDVTSRHLEVEQAYGGGFVNSINGIASGYTGQSGGARKKKDWFLFINGVLSGTGADEIKVQDGDTIWWDYHNWGTSAFTPAILGAYPQPFSRQALVLFSPSCSTQAHAIKAKLTGHTEIAELSGGEVINRKQPTILVGLLEEINDYAEVMSFFQQPSKTGLFFQIDSGEMLALNRDLQATGKRVSNGGAGIGITGSGMGDHNPLLFVIGADLPGLEKALGVLLGDAIEPRFAWGMLVDESGCYSLPGQ